MTKTYEITYDGKVQEYTFKDIKAKEMAQFEDDNTHIDDDGSVKINTGFGKYQNRKLAFFLEKIPEGTTPDDSYVENLPVAIRNVLIKAMTDMEGKSADFRKCPG